MGFLRVAARALREGRLSLPVRRVGLVYDRVEVEVDRTYADRVDFWLADALALPLGGACVDHVTSTNVLDCVSSPWAHVQSLAALLRPGGTAVITTPFDWSAQTPALGWVGGHSQRAADGGSPEPRLRRLLAEAGLTLRGDAEGTWALRLHDRAEVTYRVHMVAAQR